MFDSVSTKRYLWCRSKCEFSPRRMPKGAEWLLQILWARMLYEDFINGLEFQR
jgi:hypothetical protein